MRGKIAKRFQITLNQQELTSLEVLCEAYNESKSNIIRKGIDFLLNNMIKENKKLERKHD